LHPSVGTTASGSRTLRRVSAAADPRPANVSLKKKKKKKKKTGVLHTTVRNGCNGRFDSDHGHKTLSVVSCTPPSCKPLYKEVLPQYYPEHFRDTIFGEHFCDIF